MVTENEQLNAARGPAIDDAVLFVEPALSTGATRTPWTDLLARSREGTKHARRARGNRIHGFVPSCET